MTHGLPWWEKYGYASEYAAKRAVERFYRKVQKIMAPTLQAVRAMPAVTDADREARAIAMIRGISELGRKLRRKWGTTRRAKP